tara:strand:+ start:740 stop:2233 length:1494 start_codon:yes stop_codon:yes gene_type:complete
MKIVIVGGGTSGLVTAAIMQNYWGDSVNISLIYDPDNQSIGVGEGTTPSFIDVFNDTLGYTTEDAIRELDATIKLGVLFKNWIPNEEYYHGFGQVTCDSSEQQNDDLSDNYSAFHSLLNNTYNGGVNWNKANTLIPNKLTGYHYAFHITTDKLCNFLFDYLKDRVTLIPDVISRVTSDGKNIQSVTGKNTGNYHADLFVDASGFKSILLNELNPEWVDLSQHLPIDSAIPQLVNNNTGKIPTYTLSEATQNGWIWQIPTQERFGTGYLYSSQFTSDDEAKEDYNRWLNDNHGVQLESDRIIKWKTGHWKEAWIGNCVAVGLSGGFIEPLEALTHQYLTFMVETFVSINSTLKNLDYNRDRFNMVQNRIFFDYSQFLNLHYCTNRDDSPFWRHMTNNKTKWVRTMEQKCKHEFLDLFRNDDMLDYWGHDNYIQVMNGIHMFNKDAIKDYALSRKNSGDLLKDAKDQHEFIENSKKQFEYVDHKQFLESIKELSTLPYI